MSYLALAASLKQLAALLEKNDARLAGPELAAAAGKLDVAVSTFTKKVRETLTSKGPGIEDFTTQLNSPLGKKLLKGPALLTLSKRLLGKIPSPTATPASLKKVLLAGVIERQAGEQALEEIKRLLAELASVSSPPPKDKLALQKEFLALGRLTDDDLELTLQTRYKTKSALQALAKHNGIVVKKEFNPETLRRDIAHYARRAATNVRL